MEGSDFRWGDRDGQGHGGWNQSMQGLEVYDRMFGFWGQWETVERYKQVRNIIHLKMIHVICENQNGTIEEWLSIRQLE